MFVIKPLRRNGMLLLQALNPKNFRNIYKYKRHPQMSALIALTAYIVFLIL